MKKLLLTILSGILAIGLSAQTATFRGAWFEVDYPADFEARGSILSETAGDGTFDSAIFTSPDGEVEFYIFSPLWGGEPDDIDLTEGEKLSASEENKSEKNIVTFWTISGPRNSYLRSYQKTRNPQENTTRIVGIKYKNRKAYNRYKKQYLAFKFSLRQMAD